jgi:hypothetical protein
VTWYRLRVDLLETSPAIWRELLVPADLPLPQVSLVLQVAMRRENSHLHSFARTSETHWQSRPRWVMDQPDELIEDEEGELPESGATLATLLQTAGDRATYPYDFGDSWEHLLTAVEVLVGDSSAVVDLTSPVLTDGEGACPAEDVGGVGGYEELLECVAALERGEKLEEWPELVLLWAPRSSPSWDGAPVPRPCPAGASSTRSPTR